VSGVATLFSDEFYGHVVRYMQPDGLLVQWIQAYETDITIIASILKALSPHFQDYAVYAANDSDIIIVARPVGNLPPLAKDLFATPSVATELRLVGLQTMGDIEIRRIGNKRMLDALMRLMPVPANSDFKPFVDLNAPRMRFLNHSAVDLIALMILPTPLADISVRRSCRRHRTPDCGGIPGASTAGDRGSHGHARARNTRCFAGTHEHARGAGASAYPGLPVQQRRASRCLA
jgi:hypothetical protein